MEKIVALTKDRTWHSAQRLQKRPVMVDMPVIQDRGALRLDHGHDQALCRRRLGDPVFDHRHNAAVCAMATWWGDSWLSRPRLVHSG